MHLRQRFVGRAIPSLDRRIVILIACAGLNLGCADRTQRALAETERAETLLQQGDLAGARTAIGNAMRDRDDYLPIVLLDARIKLMSEDPSAAYEGYKLALAMDPNNAEALQGIAMLGVSAGDDRKAMEAADRILLQDPSNANARLFKGVAAINLRRFDQALALGNAILKDNPRNEYGLVLKARSLFLLGQRDQALSELTNAKTLYPRSSLVLRALLECARELGNAPLLLEQLAALRKLEPGNVDLLIDEANVRYKQRAMAGARAVSAQLLTRHGNDQAAMARLASLWREYDPQALSAEQIEQLGKTGALQARLMVARFALEKGDPAQAMQVVGSLADPEGRAVMARARQASGHFDSEAAAEAILESDKTNCYALQVRAEAFLRRGAPRKALVPAQEITAECPELNDGHLLLVRVYQALGKSSQVRRVFEEGIVARPLDPSMASAYARWLAAQGSPREGVSVARSLTVRVPTKPGAWRLFTEMCIQVRDEGCRALAEAGEKASWKNLSIDLPPGQRRPNPLLGSRV